MDRTIDKSFESTTMVSEANSRKIQKLPRVTETVVEGNGDSVMVGLNDW
jgi:hypothetical protein